MSFKYIRSDLYFVLFFFNSYCPILLHIEADSPVNYIIIWQVGDFSYNQLLNIGLICEFFFITSFLCVVFSLFLSCIRLI